MGSFYVSTSRSGLTTRANGIRHRNKFDLHVLIFSKRDVGFVFGLSKNKSRRSQGKKDEAQRGTA
ncbi:MAG: hypothetical protein EBZ44_02875 [Verrucomicrobia bacterium]|nr:hypothetical protein [bacterium]NDA10505.1 hypothetical protein [Verrucomicrobiota bacterium]NDA25654.1 hypothetical protein [Verrucomicrobiota bacterium]NDD56656.1 hypothetical protein [Verrucomicrobiota bacterium]